MKGVYKRGNKWWICYSFNGELVRKSIGYDKKLAEETLKAIRGDIVRDEHRLKKIKERRLFSEMVEEYYIEKAEKRSLDRDKASSKNLLPEFKDRLIDTITKKDIESYMNERKKKVSEGTVNREIACMKTMFSIAVKKGYIDRNPVKEVKMFNEAPWRYDKFFEKYEIYQLVKAAALHLQPILMTGFCTGLRGSDLLNLKWKHINFNNNMIVTRMQKTRSYVEIPMLPILKPVLENLKKTSNNSEFVFTYRNEKIGSVKKSFLTALKKSGLKEKGYQYKDIRRTFATMLLNNGVVLTKIQKLLGHKSITTTERYLGVKLEETRQAIQTLNQPLAKVLSVHEEKNYTITTQLPVKVPVKYLESVH